MFINEYKMKENYSQTFLAESCGVLEFAIVWRRLKTLAYIN
jgi:hypothetical protein